MIPADVKPFADDGPDKQYATYVAAGEFNIQKCDDCQQHVFYPRLICPHCGSQQLQWVTASGRGTVYSTSIPRGGPEGDYNISLIDLVEGPRMMSRVTGIAPEQVTIGMQVSAYIGEIDGIALVLFKPAEKQL